MIKKIKKEIEQYLDYIIITENNPNNRNFISQDLNYLLNSHIAKNDIFNYTVVCNEENNNINKNYINIDVYIQEHRIYDIKNLKFIYSGNEIYALQKLRKQKLEKICGKSTM